MLISILDTIGKKSAFSLATGVFTILLSSTDPSGTATVSTLPPELPYPSSSAVTNTVVDPAISSVAATGPGYILETVRFGRNDNIAHLRACDPNSNCVSSNYMEPPNRYVSPLSVVNAQDVAFQRAIRDLTNVKNNENSNIRIAEFLPKDYYIHLTVPGTQPGSLDDIELLFVQQSDNNDGGIEGKGDGIVNIRCEARVTLPPPPFCIKKNCINGNMDQRKRVEDLSYVLGLPPSDQRQMREEAKWTPIFFNSDRVPEIYDQYDE